MTGFEILRWIMMVFAIVALIFILIETYRLQGRKIAPSIRRTLWGNALIAYALAHGAIRSALLGNIPTEATAIAAIGLFLWILAFAGDRKRVRGETTPPGDSPGVIHWLKNKTSKQDTG